VETNYIWEKQVEEADVLIVYKIDLLSVEKFDLLKSKMKDIYPFKQILYQNSLLKDSVNEWVEIIGSHKKTKEYAIIDVDYLKYAVGEANLAWLDEKIEIITKDNSSVEKAYTLIDNIKKAIERNNFSIGHLKFHLSFNNKSVKVSYTTVLQDDNMNEVVREKSNHVELIVNARIESTPNDLNEIFKNAIDVMRTKDAVVINENYLAYFQPGFPNPTHRLV
jgi:G3E family GTPase